jgi:hypothetical protein
MGHSRPQALKPANSGLERCSTPRRTCNFEAQRLLIGQGELRAIFLPLCPLDERCFVPPIRPPIRSYPWRYQAFLPVFTTSWDARSLKVDIAFGLPESRLLDAAHIVADSDEMLGHAMVPNGIPLSKIHHAAFDAHLIGIDPDYRLHVSPQLLDQNDGPMLEALKKLQGASVHLPRRPKDYPDRERLSLRFERFKAAY